MYSDITTLKPHPLNAVVYGDKHDSVLFDLVKQHGIKQDYAITISGATAYCGPNVIISGHRRFYAAQAAGIKSVPVVVSDATSETDIQELLILGNIGSRDRTTEQKAREYAALKRVEEVRAKERQGARTDMVANLPLCSESGKARDIAAERVGMKPRTAEKAAQVVEVIDTAKSTGHEEYARDLTEQLNKSVALGRIPAPTPAGAKIGLVSETFETNSSRDGLEKSDNNTASQLFS